MTQEEVKQHTERLSEFEVVSFEDKILSDPPKSSICLKVQPCTRIARLYGGLLGISRQRNRILTINLTQITTEIVG